MDADLKALAADVLTMLDGQKEYFRLRNPELLNASKQREGALRKRCAAILTGKPAEPQPTLFGGPNE